MDWPFDTITGFYFVMTEDWWFVDEPEVWPHGCVIEYEDKDYGPCWTAHIIRYWGA